MHDKPKKWYYWGRWVQSMLFSSPWTGALRSPVMKKLGFALKGDMKILDGHFYILQEDVDAFCNHLDKLGLSFFDTFFQECDHYIKSIHKINNTSTFVQYLPKYLGCHTMTELSDIWLENKLQTLCKSHNIDFADVFSHIHPDKKTLLMKYHDELADLTVWDIDAFLHKWEWVGTHGFEGCSLTKDILRKSIQHHKNNIEKPNTTRKKISSKYPDEILKLIEIGKKLTFYRSELMEQDNKAIFPHMQFLQSLAKKESIPYASLISMTHNELARYLTRKSLPSDIYNRKERFGYINIQANGKIIFGDELDKELAFHQNNITQSEKELKGTVAFKGKAQGIAKILTDRKSISKVKQGDILIAPETLPDYIMAMRLADAFVTNQGGITSHAAIIAREMKKPCIIGTKIATKILRDGMLVEVDANKGIVRILRD